MKIAENIYEGVVEHSYKESNRSETNVGGCSRKMRVIQAPSKSNPDMDGHTGNQNKRYVECPGRKLQPTCIINGPGHYSEQLIIFSDFGKRYYDGRPTK